MTKMLRPKIDTPAPTVTPDAPVIKAPDRELGDEERQKDLLRKRGRSALRIDPQTGGVPKGGNGVNVPMK